MLYSTNAFSGIVNIITKRSDTTSADITLGYGSDDTQFVDALGSVTGHLRKGNGGPRVLAAAHLDTAGPHRVEKVTHVKARTDIFFGV